jgi:hypothetical protein
VIPSKTDKRWEMLVTGEIDHEFKTLAAGLLLSRLRREAKSKADRGTISRCVDEEYAFFEKYESVLRDDIVDIFGQERKHVG